MINVTFHNKPPLGLNFKQIIKQIAFIGFLLLPNAQTLTTKSFSFYQKPTFRCHAKKIVTMLGNHDDSQDPYLTQKLSRRDYQLTKRSQRQQKIELDYTISVFKETVRDLIQSNNYQDLKMLKHAIKNPDHYTQSSSFNMLYYWFSLYPDIFEHAYQDIESIELYRSTRLLKLCKSFLKKSLLELINPNLHSESQFAYRLFQADITNDSNARWFKCLANVQPLETQFEITTTYYRWRDWHYSCLELPKEHSITAWSTPKLPRLNDYSDVSSLLGSFYMYQAFLDELTVRETINCMAFVETNIEFDEDEDENDDITNSVDYDTNAKIFDVIDIFDQESCLIDDFDDDYYDHSNN